MWRGDCAVCHSTVTRSSNETGAVDFLVFDKAKGVIDVGAPLHDGKVLRASAFEAGGPRTQGAGKAAALYPLVSLEELVAWLRERT